VKTININVIIILALSVGYVSAGVFDDTFSLSTGVVVPTKQDGFGQFDLSFGSSLEHTNSSPFSPKILTDTKYSLQVLVPRSDINCSLKIWKPSADTNYCLKIWKPNNEAN